MFFLLLAATALLSFVFAYPSEPAGTQQIASPLVASCFGTACTYAAQAWKTSVSQSTTATFTTEQLAHSCLCTNGPSPSFVEWPDQLDTCIKCLESDSISTVSDYISDNVDEYCHGSMTLEAFTTAAENLSTSNKFPICLPEVVLDSSLTLSPSKFRQLPNTANLDLRQTPAGTSWSSLPASLAMNACLGTPDCYFDRLVWEWCVEQIPGAATNTTITHECLCNTFHTPWSTALEGCSTCIKEAGLPKNPSNQPTSGFPNAVKEFADAYCGITPGPTSTSILVRLGQALTNIFECPILFFNTTVLEAPVAPPKKARSLPLPFELEHLKRQTPAGTAWSTLPASPKMQACATSDGCCFARDVFDWCVNDIPGHGNAAITHNCLCENYYTQWNDGVTSCTDCIIEAGLPTNPTKYDPSTFTYWINYTMVDYCNHTQATIPQLLELGNAMTNIFESPIALFNLTVLTQPIPFPK